MSIADFIITVFCIIDDELEKVLKGKNCVRKESSKLTDIHYNGNRRRILHLVISSKGVITAATFTAANVYERDVCPELVKKIQG